MRIIDEDEAETAAGRDHGTPPMSAEEFRFYLLKQGQTGAFCEEPVSKGVWLRGSYSLCCYY